MKKKKNIKINSKQKIAVREVMRELLIEQLAESNQDILRENADLKTKLELLTPHKKEDKKQMRYIG